MTSRAMGYAHPFFMKWALALMVGVAGPASASDGTLRGRLYWGHEVRSFQPCGSKNAYWVLGEDKVLQPLRRRSEKLRAQHGKPYRPLYIEAAGVIDTDSARDGFAKDYNGLFHLHEVLRVSDLVPKRCANGGPAHP